MTTEQIMTRANAELDKLGERVLVELSLSAPGAMQLIALCQLVLRNPHLPATSRDFAKRLTDTLTKGVPEDCVGMKTLIELGWDRTLDGPTNQTPGAPPGEDSQKPNKSPKV
ncbi:MAG TPA: hypothetical protein VIW07_13055 [Candidatus Udaeobacter sp.]|jgi:hypothetical protein